MTLNNIFVAVSAAILLASCGGGEELDEISSELKNKIEEEKGKFGSTYEECPGFNAFTYTDALKEHIFFKDYFANDDSYKYYGGKLRKNKKGLTIEFSNNEAIVGKSYSNYQPGDVSFRLTVSSEEELKAGEYTSEELEIGVTRGEKVDGKVRSASIGSNKFTKKITLNEISRGHACGTYTMNDEEGNLLLEIKFDTDIELAMF